MAYFAINLVVQFLSLVSIKFYQSNNKVALFDKNFYRHVVYPLIHLPLIIHSLFDNLLILAVIRKAYNLNQEFQEQTYDLLHDDKLNNSSFESDDENMITCETTEFYNTSLIKPPAEVAEIR